MRGGPGAVSALSPLVDFDNVLRVRGKAPKPGRDGLGNDVILSGFLDRDPEKLLRGAAGCDGPALEMIQGRTVLHEVVDAKLMDMCSGDLPVKKLFLEKEEVLSFR